MGCSCTIEIDHDGNPDFISEKIVTAKKRYICCECKKSIEIGQKYEYVFGVWDGDPGAYRTCLACKSARDTFFRSWIYGEMWDCFHNEFIFDVVPEACIAKLTPEAREKVCDWIEENQWDDEDDLDKWDKEDISL